MKRIGIGIWIGGAVALVAFGFIVFGTFQSPRTETVQHGYRGTGMDLIYHRAELAVAQQNNALPDAIDPVEKSGVKAKDVYQNVKVLGDIDAAEFNRVMASFATWVAPTQGCTYCHGADGNFASDALYTKRVARRMLQMTRHINADWKSHVANVGVTCWTCHRGQPVPSYIWFNNPGTPAGMAVPATLAGDSSLPTDPLTPYLQEAKEIRVNATVPLAGTDRQSIKQTEGTYSLMMHMSTALGVNCTYCHNTRAFSNWSQSTPQRVNAWYGIRMVRNINVDYLQSLAGVFPPNRLGPHGDVPKVDCTTCHQGVFKPLLGASMIGTYPELAETTDVASIEKKDEPAPAATSPVAPAPTPAPAPPSPEPKAATPPAPPPTAAAEPTPSSPPAAAATSPEAPAPTPAPAPSSPEPKAATPPAPPPAADATPPSPAPAATPTPNGSAPSGPEPPKGADPHS